MAKVTIRHVAERAGVSLSTVSRTLHDHPRISGETKRRVLEAVRDLNYRSHLIPQDEPAKSIGLILPSTREDLLLHPFLAMVMRGISLFAQDRGYFTTYAFTCEDDERVGFLHRYADSTAVRGIVVVSARQYDPAIDFLSGTDAAFVVVGRPESAGDMLWVDNDNFHAMYDVVNRLMEHGARHVAFIGGPSQLNVTRDRLEGYRMALANRGHEYDQTLVWFTSEFSEPAGYRAMRGVLAIEPPDAVVTTDDLLGLGALRALAERNLVVPCVGFNNTAQAQAHAPSLSSVELQPCELGRQAARLLIERIENGFPQEDHVIVPTRFVQRQTTGGLRG